VILLLSLALTLSACSVSPGSTASSDTTAGSTDVIEGTFDVGGHSLFIDCEGSGSPTIIYLHAATADPASVPHLNGMGIQRDLLGEYRVCAYDRRNVGQSESVDSVQTPDDAINDMRNLLGAAAVEPPYVLLGSSLGGLLAYLYANTYPDEVVGMVMLDSPFPDELSLENMFPPEERHEAFHEEQATDSLERLSLFSLLEQTQQFIGQEPAIPVTYFSSIPEGRGTQDFGQDPEYNEVVLDVQKAFVDRFSPGTYIRVDAPHLMEGVIRDEIAEAVRSVITQAGF
jgi:pimeloyl-ACP methyl ester carboxylesterase